MFNSDNPRYASRLSGRSQLPHGPFCPCTCQQANKPTSAGKLHLDVVGLVPLQFAGSCKGLCAMIVHSCHIGIGTFQVQTLAFTMSCAGNMRLSSSERFVILCLGGPPQRRKQCVARYARFARTCTVHFPGIVFGSGWHASARSAYGTEIESRVPDSVVSGPD